MDGKRSVRQLVAGISAGALAASFAATLGVGAASAAEASTSGSVRVYNFGVTQTWVDVVRTIDKSVVEVGDTVTVTTKLQGSGDSVRVYAVEDWHDPCLVYQQGSGSVSGGGIIAGNSSVNESADEVVVGKPSNSSASYLRNATLTASYTVTCDPVIIGTGGMNAKVSPASNGGGLGSGWLDELSTGTGAASPPSGLKSFGPSITVQKGATTTSKVTYTGTPQVGAPTTLSASVADGTEGVDVTFTDAADATLCTAQLGADGTASCVWTPTGTDPVSITANYAGDANTAASSSVSAIDVTPAAAVPGALTVTDGLAGSYTDGDSVTIGGTVGADTTGVTVSVGADSHECTVDGGRFTCTFPAALADDGAAVSVTPHNGAIDGAVQDVGSLSVDPLVVAPSTAPSVSVSPNPVVDGETVTVSGSAASGSTGVSVRVDGAEACVDVELDADGGYSCTFVADRGLMDGTSVTVVSANTAGASPVSEAVVLQVEAPAPAVPGAPQITSTLPETVTAGDAVTVSGNVDANTTAVSMTVGGVEYGSCTVTAAGSFTCTVSAAETMDGGDVAVTAENDTVTGGTAQAGTLHVVPAPQPGEPTVTIQPSSPKAGDEVTITVTDPTGSQGDTVTVAVTHDGKTTDVCTDLTLDAAGNATCTWTPSTEGEYTLDATIGSGDDAIEATATVTVKAGESSGDDGNGNGNGGGSLDWLTDLFGGSGSADGSGSPASLGSTRDGNQVTWGSGFANPFGS